MLGAELAGAETNLKSTSSIADDSSSKHLLLFHFFTKYGSI